MSSSREVADRVVVSLQKPGNIQFVTFRTASTVSSRKRVVVTTFSRVWPANMSPSTPLTLTPSPPVGILICLCIRPK